MSGVMEFKIYEDKLKHNILEMCKEEIDFRKLIGDTYNIAYYKDLMNRNIIIVVDDNGYGKNLKTTFVLGKKLPEGIKVYSEYELKGNVYMAKIYKKSLEEYEFDILSEDDIRYVFNKIYEYSSSYILAVQYVGHLTYLIFCGGLICLIKRRTILRVIKRHLKV